MVLKKKKIKRTKTTQQHTKWNREKNEQKAATTNEPFIPLSKFHGIFL